MASKLEVLRSLRDSGVVGVIRTENPGDLEASWDTIRVNSLNLSVTIRDPSLYL